MIGNLKYTYAETLGEEWLLGGTSTGWQEKTATLFPLY